MTATTDKSSYGTVTELCIGDVVTLPQCGGITGTVQEIVPGRVIPFVPVKWNDDGTCAHEGRLGEVIDYAIKLRVIHEPEQGEDA